MTERSVRTGGNLVAVGTRRRGSRRLLILEVAAELFRRRGFHATSINEIGAAAGVSGPAVYKHFSGKHQLLGALIGELLERLRSDTDEVLARGASPEKTLDELIDRGAAMSARSTDLLAIAYQEFGALDDPDRDRLVGINRTLVSDWRRVLMQVRPQIPEAEARTRIAALFGLLDGAARSRDGRRPEELEKLLASMIYGCLMSPSPSEANAFRRRRSASITRTVSPKTRGDDR